MLTLLPPHAALLLEAHKTRAIAIADLHIGWEIAFSNKGIHVPTQTYKLLQKLSAIVSEYKPEKLFILGDVKHTIATADLGEWRDVPSFFDELNNQIRDIGIVRGNHDGNLEPLLPEGARFLPADGAAFGNIGFFHGHQWPSPNILRCKTLIMGHVHPVVVFRDIAGFRVARQVWVIAKCDKTLLTRAILQKNNVRTKKSPEETLMKYYKIRPQVTQLIIMPSFNDFLGGRPLNEGLLSSSLTKGTTAGPVLRSGAINMNEAETYLLDGTFLGTLNQLAGLE